MEKYGEQCANPRYPRYSITDITVCPYMPVIYIYMPVMGVCKCLGLNVQGQVPDPSLAWPSRSTDASTVPHNLNAVNASMRPASTVEGNYSSHSRRPYQPQV